MARVTHSIAVHSPWLLIVVLALPAGAQTPTGERPPSRQHHAITYDPALRRVLIHGGLSRDSIGPRDVPPLDDLWSWDGTSWISEATATGLGLVGHQFFARRDGSWFVTAGAPAHVTSRWNGDQWITVTNDSSRRRDLAAGAYDPVRDRFVLFGGRINRSTRSGETWEFDGQTWSLLASDGPPARLGASLVYDEGRRQMVLFGGRDGPTYFGDTWTWDGAVWRRLESQGPSPRLSAGMAYDARRAEVVLFGGWNEGGFQGDTWLWNGAAWRRAEVSGPSPRADGLIAFDAARAVTVLFGGTGPSLATLGDTWEWNGAEWVERR